MPAQHVVVSTKHLDFIAKLLVHLMDDGEYVVGSLHDNYYGGVSENYGLSFERRTYKSFEPPEGATSAPLGLQAGNRYTLHLDIMAPKPDPEVGGSTSQLGTNQTAVVGTDGPSREKMLEDRLTKLIETLNKDMHNSNLKNIAFEIGRPVLEPTAQMKRNPANPYGRFSIDELFKMKIDVVSNNMATTEQMAKITADIAGLGVPSEQVAEVILKMVIMCASVSSSAFLDPDGSIEFGSGAVPVDSIAAIMKKHAGLRKVCRLYAPIVWNSMLVRNQPPSDWQAMGFPFNARFAAFDTFDYVTNTAAIQPVEGIIRRPTSEEVIAHNAHKRLALDRANRNDRFGNLETEYTGGIQGAEITRNHRNANNG
nr:5' extended coat protein [Kalanchoe latent virus]